MEGQTIATARIDIVGDASGIDAATARAKESIANMSRDARAQYSQLSVAERRRIDTMLRQAETIGMSRAEQIKYNAQLRASGPLLSEITKRVEASSAALAKSSKEFNQYGVSAAQQAAALRGTPAQITDIVVSLQGGQRPLTVLLQQGGQLKDMFGGIVPAAKALSSTFLGMINPVTLSATAFAALGAAWYQGSREMEDFRTHLTMTGGAVGLSVDQLSQMASQMDAMAGVTRGRAVEALTEVAKSGKIAGDQIGLVGEVAVRSSRILGREISDVVDEFAKLAEEPAKASAKLNEQYNYLTASVYDQIRALEEQGNKQEAAKIAQETYAQVTNERLGEVEQSLGYIERAWKAVGTAATGAWDAMKGIGRSATNSELIQGLEDDIRTQTEILESFGLSALSTFDEIERAMIRAWNKDAAKNALDQISEGRAEIARLMSEQAGDDFIARAQGINAQENQAAIQAAERVHKMLDDVAPKAEKARKAVEEYHRELDKIRKANPDSELLNPESIAKAEKAIRDRFKEAAGKAYSNDAATRQLMALREQEAALRAQIEGSAKLTEQQKRLAAFEQQIADIRGKQVRTADERSILAAENRLRTQLETNVAVEKEALAREAVLKFQERAAQVAEQMSTARDNQNEQYQRVLDSFGFGDKAMERVQAQRAIYKEFEKYQRQLSRGAELGLIGQERYREESDKIQAELQRRLAMEQSYYDEVDRLQASWALGAQQGLANYADEAANVFQSVNNLAVQSFQGMEDAIVQFATTGKMSFSDLTNSIIEDMIRITVQQSITGPLAGALGNVMGSWFGGGGFSTPQQSVGGSIATVDLTRNALGGVYDSPSLSAYSGGVYDKPQFFAFAKGAGVFGEAGPEAIMPLRRGSDGSLGVRAELPRMPAVQASMPQVIVNVQGAQGEPEVTTRRDQNGNLNVDLIWKQVSRQMAGEVASGQGQFVRSIERRYALTPKLG